MLQVVETWIDAINAGDADGAAAVSQDQIIVAGPRGKGPMPASALGEWLARSGFSGRPTRWFCGGDGLAVVELEARWPGSPDHLMVGAMFRVTDGRIAEFARFDDGLAAALAAGGLVEERDEVTVKA